MFLLGLVVFIYLISFYLFTSKSFRTITSLLSFLIGIVFYLKFEEASKTDIIFTFLGSIIFIKMILFQRYGIFKDIIHNNDLMKIAKRDDWDYVDLPINEITNISFDRGWTWITFNVQYKNKIYQKDNKLLFGTYLTEKSQLEWKVEQTIRLYTNNNQYVMESI